MGRDSTTAAIIAVGDELLRGDTQDTNTGFLCSELYLAGVDVRWCQVIPDEVHHIANSVQDCVRRFSWVIVCGGIGPTPDDLTRQAAAQAMSVPLELNQTAVEEYQRRRGRELNAGQLEMCRLPAGSELVWSEFPSPPGFLIANLLVLPGVPAILKSMWRAAAARFRGTPKIVEGFRTTAGESRWSHVLAGFIDRYPQLKFGSYPKMGDEWWVEVRVEGHDQAEVRRVAASLELEIRREIECRG